MNNHKNKLQEIFQKRGQQVVYELVDHRFIREGNVNEFKCRVICAEVKAISDWCTSKKKAEMNAAEKAYNKINNEEKLYEPDFSTSTGKEKYEHPNPEDTEFIVLIDIENRPKLVNLPYKSNVSCCGFISKYSNHVEQEEKLSKLCDLKIIDSPANNAADIQLIFWAGGIVVQLSISDLPKPQIIIVTRDRFGGPLRHLIKEQNINCHVAVTEQDLRNLGVLQDK